MAYRRSSRGLDFHLVALAAVLVAVALIRLRLLGVPFERDEGEYAYVGGLILNGGLPYRDAYNMKLPGVYGVYALIMAAFGSSPAGVHAGFALASLATITLLYSAFRRLFTPMVGLTAAAAYALLSVSGPLLGQAAHATHFVNLFVAAGLWALSRWDDRRPLRSAAAAGLLFGLAILMKQHAVFLAAFGGLMTVHRKWTAGQRGRRATVTAAAVYGAAALAPYAGVVAVAAASGSFDRFWFWSVTYATSYASADTPWGVAWALFRLTFGRTFTEYPLVWILAGAGLIAVWVARFDFRQRLLATTLAAASVAAVLPGFNFREHYFVLLLPASSLLAAIALECLARALASVAARVSASGSTSGRASEAVLAPGSRLGLAAIRALPFVAMAAFGIAAIVNGRWYYLDASPDEISRRLYPGNPFVEIRDVAARLAADTTPSDTVAVLGSEPELFVYAGRRSATGYMYVYPLVEPQPYNVRMQREMIAEIEAAAPKYFVYCSVPASWAASPGAPTDILQWFNRYAPAHYDVAGIVDVGSAGTPAAYHWDAAAARHVPGPNSLWVLRRKGA